VSASLPRIDIQYGDYDDNMLSGPALERFAKRWMMWQSVGV